MRKNKSKNTRRKVVVAGALALLLVGGGAAYAYWTTTSGSGSGTATTAKEAASIVIRPAMPVGIKPGGKAQPLTGTLANLTGDSKVYVERVSATIASVSKGTTANGDLGAVIQDPLVCSPADFELFQTAISTGSVAVVTIPVEKEVSSVTEVSWGGDTLAAIGFVDDPGKKQDGCKNVTVNISYTFE